MIGDTRIENSKVNKIQFSLNRKMHSMLIGCKNSMLKPSEEGLQTHSLVNSKHLLFFFKLNFKGAYLVYLMDPYYASSNMLEKQRRLT